VLDLAQAHTRDTLRRYVTVRDEDREAGSELHGDDPGCSCRTGLTPA
jgi:hypothetical protein